MVEKYGKDRAMVIGLILAGIFVFYWFLVFPGRLDAERMRPYRETCIAHRGLYDNHSDAPENTIAAFRKAVEHGYGIELDVQLSEDGQVVVAHDRTLRRIARVDGAVRQYSYEQLRRFPLFGTEERIPLFARVLEEVGGAVPLIVEIKAGQDYRELCEKTACLLDAYSGEYCVESFSPLAVRWFRRNRPDWIRGQLSTDYRKDHLSRKWYADWFLGGFMLNFIGRPHFLAYNHRYAGQLRFRAVRAVCRGRAAAWTIRNPRELARARKRFDIFIFERFLPPSGRQDGTETGERPEMKGKG